MAFLRKLVVLLAININNSASDVLMSTNTHNILSGITLWQQYSDENLELRIMDTDLAINLIIKDLYRH
jgi:hypothetical protein